MVAIPAGSFTMGSPDGESYRELSEGPQRRVSVRAFAVGKHEVMRGEYAAFVEATGRENREGCNIYAGHGFANNLARDWRRPGYDQNDRYPVVCMSWDDAHAYAAWLSQKTSQRYRLLTEAEWEYVARAGTATTYPWGSDAGKGHANCKSCDTPSWGRGSAIATGSFPANAFGLHDMIGNVWEWTEDCWNENYAGAPSDAAAQSSGDCSRRVLRGGSWIEEPPGVRAAYRIAFRPSSRIDVVGFRIARNMD